MIDYVEPHALQIWNVNIFKIVDKHVKFYSQNTNHSLYFSTSTARYPRISEKVCLGTSRQGRKQRCCCLPVILHSDLAVLGTRAYKETSAEEHL